MAFQTVFKRYELKYIITGAQKERIKQCVGGHLLPDKYGKNTIRNIYFDTPSYRLIRRSIEKPDYKEKLRVRSYGNIEPDSTVFVELKKKHNGVVYKRRVSMKENEAMDWICNRKKPQPATQIINEVDYFLEYYGSLQPAAFLSYEREAFYMQDDHSFRLTFDENILCRQTDLSLHSEPYGTMIVDEDTVLMEIKCTRGIPLWMTEILSREHIYKTSFSKYGTAYRNIIYKDTRRKNK